MSDAVSGRSRACRPSAQHRDAPLARHRLRPHAERMRWRPQRQRPQRHHLSAGFCLSEDLSICTSMPGGERGKAFIAIFNLLLVSYHDESSPSHSLAFTAPSQLSRAGTLSVQGCKADAGKESPLLTSAGMQDLATWNPDRRHVFSCPARSEPPWGRCVHFSREPSLHQPSLNLLPRNSSSPQPGP